MSSETKTEPVIAPTKPEAPTAVDQLAALSEADRNDTTPAQLVLRLKVGAGVQRFVIDVAEDSSWFGSWAWTPHTFPADGTPEGEFREFAITGLLPATLYAVRVTVHNTAGEAVGDVVRGLTTMAPDAALTVWRARAKALQAERDAALAEKALTTDEATKRRAAEIAAVKQQLEALTSSTVTMQKELEEARAALPPVEEELSQSRTAQEAMQGELEELRALLAGKEEHIVKLEADAAKVTEDSGSLVAEVKKEMETLKAAHEEQTSAFQAAQERLLASETSLREVSAKLEEALQAKVTQEELVADLNAEAAALQERAAGFEQKAQEAEAAKEVVSRELMACNAKVEALEASLETTTARVAAMESTAAEGAASTAAAVAEAVRATEDEKRKVALLEATIEGMKIERSATTHADTSALDTLKSENFALRAGYDEVVAAQDGVTKERDTAKAEAAEAARQLASANERVAELDRMHDELKQAAARERTQLDTLTAERNALTAQVERQQRELSEYPARLVQLEDENTRLQEEVKRVSAMASMVRVESEAREHFRAHLPEPRLEEYVAHFVALKGMGFDTASAQAAVVKHPDSRDMQVTYCLSASR